jgi:hypothetical protein
MEGLGVRSAAVLAQPMFKKVSREIATRQALM